MFNRIEKIGLQPQQQVSQISQNVILSPEFFGKPGPMDKIRDMQMCRTLGIDTNGMDRETIKASILSQLTGKSVQEMQAFFMGASEQDMRKDLQLLSQMGMEPSSQPNLMMARSENKANIANGWMAGIETEDISAITDATNTGDISEVQSDSEVDSSNATKSPPQTPPEIAAFMSSLGLQPTNSKEGDYAAITAKLAEMMASAKDPNEKQTIQCLMSQFNNLFCS